MAKAISSTVKKPRRIGRTILIIVLILLALAIIVGIFIARHKTTSYQFVAVTQGPISETVSVTGNTTPTQSVSLGFGNSGTISKINFAVGQNVTEGQVLAELNTNDLQAQVEQAQANVDTQQAQLAGLLAGSKPQQIALDQQKYSDAASALLLAINTAYVNIHDAVMNKTQVLFNNPNSANPTIIVASQTSDQGRAIDSERVALETTLNQWQATITSGDLNGSQLAAAQVFTATNLFLSNLNAIASTLYPANSGLTQSQIDSITSSLSAASQEVSGAASSEQAAETAWSTAGNTLALDKAGSTPQDIQAQNAVVESAQAAVLSAQAKLQNSEIVAPISGVITQFDAKVGQSATPSVSLISIISGDSFEVDALVSEIDIGKVAVGNKVSMTLDAFPGETFNGTVFYIDPGQTTTNGVVGYNTKISFDVADPRIKSGLTTNLTISTRSKPSVLILPQYAILQNDQGTFVEVLQNGKIQDVPVTLGLQDQNGNVEIVSGVTAGEQVLNIGLKT